MRTEITKNPAFRVFTLEPGDKVDLRHLDCSASAEIRPVECHIMEDGAIGDKPSLCLVLKTKFGNHVIAQISAEMFEPVFRELADFYPIRGCGPAHTTDSEVTK